MLKALMTALSYGCCGALLAIVVVTGAGAQQTEGSVPPPGTVITMQNWQQYKDVMEQGLQILFSGQYFWKFPADFQMEICQTHDFPLPKK